MLFPVLTVGASAQDFYLSENFALKSETYACADTFTNAPSDFAVDGDLISRWRTFSNTTQKFLYLTVTFEEMTDVNFVFLLLYEFQKMNFIEIQYTADPEPSESSSWTTVATIQSEDLFEDMFISFDTVTATGIRFYAEVSEHNTGLYELQAYYTNNPKQAEAKILKSFERWKPFTQAQPVDSKIVSVGDNGELIYADYNGDGATLIDYSYAGYKNGAEPIPNVKVVKTIDAKHHADHTKLIQDAIDEVSALPLEERGAILLKAGKYTVSSDLYIKASGIVLRGEGQGENGTVIYDSRTKSGNTLRIKGSATTTVTGEKKTLKDTYVPVGNTTLELSSILGFTVGSQVSIECTPNDQWIKTLGMDMLSGTGVPWVASGYVMTYEREIVAVDTDEKTITINVGIPLTLDDEYFSVTVQGIEDAAGRISECGVENIRFLSYYNESTKDSDHATDTINLNNCRNCWVRDVTTKHYVDSLVNVGKGSINVTVENCSAIEPIYGGKTGVSYQFYIGEDAEFVLFKNCYSSDSVIAYSLGKKAPGPIAFVDCVAVNANSGAEPHHRWSTGVLFDNIYSLLDARETKSGELTTVNSGNGGTGHGWMGANVVYWNCLGSLIFVEKPQTEQNFAVGVSGIYDTVSKDFVVNGYKDRFVAPSIEIPDYPETKHFENSPMHGNGYIEAAYNPVNPSSLYRAQLSYRLYGDATKNVAPSAPILEYPKYDTKSDSYTVAFSGTSDINAEKVYIWVDGEKHEANLSGEVTGAYSAELYLKNGHHDICVSQVINGTESAPTPIRSLIVECDEPYVDPAETDETQTNNNNNNTSAPQNSSLGVIIAIAAVACVAVGACVFFVVKKFKKK